LSPEDEVDCISPEYFLILSVYLIAVSEYAQYINKYGVVNPTIGEAIQAPFSLVSNTTIDSQQPLFLTPNMQGKEGKI
jgi:hypothetical protein